MNAQRMIPKSGNRFSDKIMLKQNLGYDPIQLNWIMPSAAAAAVTFTATFMAR